MDIKDYIQSGIIEKFVLGLASAEEVMELNEQRTQSTKLNDAVLDFEKSFEAHAMANKIAAPAFIKSALEKKLFSETGNKAIIIENDFSTNVKNKPSIYNTGFWKYLAAACIILLITSTALNFYFYSGYKNSQQQYQALLTEKNTLQANNASYKQSLQMFEDTAMLRIDMKGMPGKEQNLATVLWNKNSKDVYIYVNNMQQIPLGKQYQLWAIVDGKPVDAGVIDNCTGVCKMKKIDHAEAFAISLEKEGGNATPTEVYVLGKV